MIQLPDTSAIRRLIRGARTRIRLQAALEGATTATVLAAAGASLAIFAVRSESVDPGAGIWMLACCGALIVLGAVAGSLRRLDDERVARRIDRASNLADRLSTAIAFSRVLDAKRPAGGPGSGAGWRVGGPGFSPPNGGDVTEEMMVAAIRDGVRAVPRANLRAATPFARPRDLWTAIGFLAVSALVAGFSLPPRVPPPQLFAAVPDHAPPGAAVAIRGKDLGAIMPADAMVELGAAKTAITDWQPTEIDVKLPDDAALGLQKLVVFGKRGVRLGEVAITVVDPRDPRYHKEDSVVLDPDERAYVKSILAELHEAAQRDKVPELDDFAKQIEKLLEQADKGELSKEELLDALQKAEDALHKDAEPNQDEVDKKLADMGKELAKDPMTKDLGDALQKQDLQKAQQELDKLADKLDKHELDKKQQDDLAKKLDDVAKQMQKQDTQEQKQSEQKQQKVQKDIEQLQKQQQDAKTPQEKQEIQERLDEKQRELQKLQREEQQKQQSSQRRALQRLQKDMEKAAEDMQQKQEKDGQNGQQQQDGQQQDGQKQASRSLHDAARETGKVDSDRRKQATQKKMSSQMDDLREAMRRAKQKGSKGPQDPFNRNGKNSDFAQRARGQQGQGGQGWKPGQNGQGQNGQNGQNQGGDQGGDSWGTEHDDNLTGDPTQMSGHDKDAELQGTQSKDGGSTRETILAAAQKGFASVGYSKVYANYERVIEEVMRTEKLPSSYKYYVKRYFAKIHPDIVATQGDH